MKNDRKAISVSSDCLYYIDKQLGRSISYETLHSNSNGQLSSAVCCSTVSSNIKTYIKQAECSAKVIRKNKLEHLLDSNVASAKIVDSKHTATASAIVYKNNLLRVKENNISVIKRNSWPTSIGSIDIDTGKSISYLTVTTDKSKAYGNCSAKVNLPIKTFDRTGEALVFVASKNQNSFNVKSNQAEAFVEDYKPPSLDGLSSAQGLKNAKIVLQKESFADLKFDFSDVKVVGANGLPTGMYFEHGRIKGSPIQSSSYPVELLMNNKTKLKVLFVVPNLERKL